VPLQRRSAGSGDFACGAGGQRRSRARAVVRHDALSEQRAQMIGDETREYVKRVMLSWSEYRRLYGGAAK